eukprot:CAMPEP_0194156864 /NCGR_PEP_ID=MMETSP0152-20130528/69833_1 /TAXON_ID=1049557 /ORGANISM="Thalassiothrix antarctica, Strain L6-D1" /LENGTH=35 /DNA_ID= /DNA_START= /DNA_END= /DNA_ORIENTATION=
MTKFSNDESLSEDFARTAQKPDSSNPSPIMAPLPK